MNGKSILIGVDVGGTKIKAGAITQAGGILHEPVTQDTGGSDEKEIIFDRIASTIEQSIINSGSDIKDISGIGMGVTGPLDTQTGTILECPQLPTMHSFPLKNRIGERFKLPVCMDNDANALLLGESLWGAGKDCRTTLGFTLGTGLGCAIIIDNQIFTGSNGMAGEIWPSPFREETIEDLVSGRGISGVFKKLSGEMKNAKEISTLARDGNPKALETWKIFGEALAFSLAWGINLIDPDIVILGGSITNSLDLFYQPMETELRKFICPVPALKTRVVKAALGDNAGFMGAAGLLMQKNYESKK